MILGDSAHAMVPFYGQGMNCGFEDVLVLDEILQKHLGKVAPASPTTEYISLERPTPKVLEAVLEEYSKTRNPDAEAMCDLAMYNYIEMRSSVVDPGYLFRKKVEGFLHKLFPSVVIPLYTMVSFTRIPYSQAMARWKKQTTWFETLRLVAGTLSFAAVWGVVGLVTYKKLRV